MDSYPANNLTRETVYKVPPGWFRVTCALIEGVAGLQEIGEIPPSARIAAVLENRGRLKVELKGLEGGKLSAADVAIFCSAYADMSEKTCVDCGYPREIREHGSRPLCRTCDSMRRLLCLQRI